MDAAELRAYADQLDPLMRHLLIDSLFDTIQNGTHVVFFGAAWCPYTQQYTPVWLNAQDQLAYHHPSTRLQMHKISCQDAQHKCFHYMRERDNAYPTVVLFRDGDYIEEVIDRDRVWEYIDLLARGGMNGPLSAGEVVKVERAVGLDFLSTITATSAYSILQHNTTLLYFTSSDRNLRDTDSAYLAAQIVPLPPRFSLHRVNCTANHTICGNLMRSENTPRLVLYHAGWHVQDLTAQAALLSTSLKQAVRVVSKCRYAQWKHRRTIVLDPAKHDGFVLDEPSFRVAIRAETARRASLPGDAAAWEGGITWDAWSRMWLVGGVVMGLGVLVAFFVLFRRMRWRVKYLVVGGRKRGL